MTAARPFRFGVQVAGAAGGKEWAALAREAEDLGYSTLLMPDHFDDQLAPGPALAAAAAATSELRVGHLVLGNDYRHPAVLGKEVATLDVLSDGRAELGLGAGWMKADYERTGIERPPADQRIARLEESVRICRGLWADGELTHSGEHYRITGLDGLPKPVQRPGPPVLIGGGGPKLLGVAARHADVVGVNMPIPGGRLSRLTPEMIAAEAVDDRIGLVRAAAGERFDELELNVFVYRTMVGPDWRSRRGDLADFFGTTAEAVDATPHFWVGDAARVADQLRAARDRWGFSYVVVHTAAAMRDAAAVVAELRGE